MPADGDVAAESADISQTGAKNPADRDYGHADEVADGLDGRFVNSRRKPGSFLHRSGICMP